MAVIDCLALWVCPPAPHLTGEARSVPHTWLPGLAFWRFKLKLFPWQGRTGYPFIDAIMTQLRTEGWIHHLARHAVACFLTRGDLWISWEQGQKVRHVARGSAERVGASGTFTVDKEADGLVEGCTIAL